MKELIYAETRRKIGVTGLGLVSPFGCTLAQFMNGLATGRNCQREITLFTNPSLQKFTGVEIDLPGVSQLSEARLLVLGEQALRAALTDWGQTAMNDRRIGLVIGSGLGMADLLTKSTPGYEDNDYLSSLGRKLANRLGVDWEVIYIGNACAAGSHAISYGMDLLQGGYFDVVIAGGIDMLSQVAYGGFLRLNAVDPSGCHPFDRDRKGIMVGEGAAFFVIERIEENERTTGKKYCRLAGTGVSNDAYSVVQLKPDGQEIKRAMDQALQSAGLAKADIDLVVAHGTGTIQNDKCEAQIITDYFKDQLSSLAVTAPKGAIGHTGGAGGPFGLVVAIGAILTGEVPPISNLRNIDPECAISLVYQKPKQAEVQAVMVNTFAFGGADVIIICQKWDGEY